MDSRATMDRILRGSVLALAAMLVPFGLGGSALAADDAASVRGVSTVGHATATIMHPTALRTDALLESGMDFTQAPGLAVAPASVVQRDCRDEQARQRCALIILDMP